MALTAEERRNRRNESAKRWYHNDIERGRARNRRNNVNNAKTQDRWRAEHRQELTKRSCDWQAENRDKVNVRRRQRRLEDVNYRLACVVRNRVLRVVSGKKSAPTLELLGCTIDHLKWYLESQFIEGMCWSNYGAWHIDHKRPCASFDLRDPAQQRECFNWRNLQPLWARDNLSKGARWQ